MNQRFSIARQLSPVSGRVIGVLRDVSLDVRRLANQSDDWFHRAYTTSVEDHEVLVLAVDPLDPQQSAADAECADLDGVSALDEGFPYAVPSWEVDDEGL